MLCEIFSVVSKNGDNYLNSNNIVVFWLLNFVDNNILIFKFFMLGVVIYVCYKFKVSLFRLNEKLLWLNFRSLLL